MFLASLAALVVPSRAEASTRLAFSSGELDLELGGDVSGVPRAHWLAVHELGVDVPGLIVDAIDKALGNDLVRAGGNVGLTGRASLGQRIL